MTFNDTFHRMIKIRRLVASVFASFVISLYALADDGSSSTLSFRRNVMPVLFRAGCNAGTCHGSARGKDGFMLSLFGYDPKGDYFRITQEMIGRRVNTAVPEQSLLLQKAVGAVPHTGGKRFDQDSEYYQTLLRWIESGHQMTSVWFPILSRSCYRRIVLCLKRLVPRRCWG